MPARPIIGVPTQTLQAIDGIPEGLPHSWVMNHRYFLALTAVGALPWMVPLLSDDPDTLRGIYDRLDGVFIAGGVDMHPESYGEEVHELCGRTDPPRDTVELLFARWALEEGKPILGVCRGMQVINVAAGGSLYQDCGEQFSGSIKHDYFPNAGFARDHLAHEIEMEAGTRLRGIYGSGTALVNSMHHQGIRTMGAGLRSSAYAPDGLIEALEDDGEHRFAIGVQWHPEMLIDTDAPTRRLFATFVQSAVAYSANGELAGAAV
ncbi:gamma-glutamyl-gamma-aminobutyrate hydrolase family protein [soil metagenome]